MLENAFALPPSRAFPSSNASAPYSFHAPEVEIGRGKAAAPYEFGVKASAVTNDRPVAGAQFVLNAKALPDNSYDDHTLRDLIDRSRLCR